MGIFSKLKAKESTPVKADVITACSNGRYVPMNELSDEVFSSGMLGKCCGIVPAEGKVYAPIDGAVSTVADTLHAIGISGNGLDILIHVGIDTVKMNGDGFSSKIKEGQKIKKGDLLLTMDLEKIKAMGYPTVVITIVTNTDDFKDVSATASGEIKVGAELMKIDM